jgi:acetyl-CoA carboxylase biotin carboxyl carrier protein
VEYRADMVASVLHVLVSAGESVDFGQTLVMLESMKMEIPVMAEAAGTVVEVAVVPGDVVQEGDVLVVVN